MNNTLQTPSYDFAGKYENASVVGAALINSFYRHVVELLHRAQPSSLLEVGCGEGYSTARVSAAFPLVPMRAVEVEPVLVQRAQQRNPHVPVAEGSIYALGAVQADVVMALEVLEHLDDPTTAVLELLRVSRRYVLVSVPREPLWRTLNVCRGKYWSGLGNTPGHIQHWSRHGFLAWLSSDPVSQHARIVASRSPVPWTMVLLERRPAQHV